jgi:hypothetical protein
MKKTFAIITGIFVFGFLFSLTASAQTEIKKEDNKTIKTEQTVKVKSTDNQAPAAKTTKPPCDPSKCKTTCKDKQKAKACCPGHKKAKKAEATDPKKQE